MLIVLIVSQILLFALVIALIATSIALARQIGILHERVAPVGVLTPRSGPAVSEIAPQLVLPNIHGGTVQLGGPAARKRLLLFVGPSCPICKKLIPIARAFAHAEHLDLVLATDAAENELAAMIERERLHDLPMVNSRDLGLAYAVDKLPHAVLLSTTGTIVARGLANTREHLESLVVADELGVGSVQEFLRQRSSNRLNA
jgi:methylamine dehydrogenase accessory protein MauD